MAKAGEQFSSGDGSKLATFSLGAAKKYAPRVLRASLGIVFLWFGVDKFVNPGYWARFWVPDFLSVFLGGSVISFLYALGVFEVGIGLALAFNVFSRYAGLLASIFLAVNIAVQGVSPVVRDIGLLGSAIFIAARGDIE